VRTLLTLAQYKLLITSMKWQGGGLSQEIRIGIQEIITVFLLEKAGLDSDSAIEFLTGSALFDKFQVRTLTTRP